MRGGGEVLQEHRVALAQHVGFHDGVGASGVLEDSFRERQGIENAAFGNRLFGFVDDLVEGFEIHGG